MTAIYRGYDAATLAAQYDNAAAVPNHQDIVGETMRMSDEYRAKTNARLDLPYGPTRRQAVDIYPAAKAGGPVLFFIHGGLWVRREKKDFGFLAAPLNAAGVNVVIVEYDLCPSVTLPVLVEQVRSALDWTFRNAASFGGDPAQLHVAGHSAGGHLAAMMAITDWAARGLPADVLKSVTAISGIYDMQPMRLIPLNAQLKLDEATAKALSPDLGTPPQDLPILVAVGDAETDEFVRQTRMLVHTWRTEGCDVELLEAPGDDHFTILRALGDRTHPMTDSMFRIMGFT
jgi:arylformamidase